MRITQSLKRRVARKEVTVVGVAANLLDRLHEIERLAKLRAPPLSKTA